MNAPPALPEKPRCGFIALIGAPNAGKSTLVNALVEAKVSIVTHKVQTTRMAVRGVFVEGDGQAVLIDAPGVFAAKKRLERAMVAAAWGNAREADMALCLIDARKKPDAAERALLQKAAGLPVPCFLVLNKIDKMARAELLQRADEASAQASFAETFMISALRGMGISDLKAALLKTLPEGPWHYPPEQISDLSERLLAADITREKLLLRLHQEIPYDSMVETEMWEEHKDGSVKISQVIYVARAGQKKIVLGGGGETIKWISMRAREDLERQLERKVHLFLYVKVRENWSEQRQFYNTLGLDYDA